MKQIILDCVPYGVSLYDSALGVLDCYNSILGRLDNDPSVTGNRFSDLYKYTYTDCGRLLRLEVCKDEIVFDAEDGQALTLEVIVDWIDLHWDRIESIGYETLLRWEQVS